MAARHARTKPSSEGSRAIGWLVLLAAVIMAVLMSQSSTPASYADEASPTADDVAKSTFLVVSTWTGYAEVPVEADVPTKGPVDDFPTDLPTFEQSTERIDLTFEGGPCTGFFVSTDGYGVSASHCFDEQLLGRPGLESELQQKLFERAQDSDDSSSFFPQDLPEIQDITLDKVMVWQADIAGTVVTDWREATTRFICTPDMGGDHAILKLDDPPSGIVPLTVSDSEPELKEELIAVGYPGSHIEGINQPSDQDAPEQSLLDSIKSSDVRPTTTVGHMTGKQIMDGVELYETDTSMDGGMSGGPTVNDRNEVVGVVSGGYYAMGGNFNFISKGETLRADLIQAGVLKDAAPQTAASSGSSQDSSPFWQGMLGGLVGAVLLGLLIGLIYLLRKRKARKARSTRDATDSTPPTLSTTS